MFSGEQHTNTNKRKDVASTAYEEMLKKVAFRGHQKSQHVLRIPITSPITTPFPPPSSSTTHIPSITNSSPLLSVGPSQQCSHLSLSSNSPHPTSKCVDPMASTPIVMMPTPGLRQSPRDTPQSFLGIGSSSQSAPPGPTLDFLHDDMDEDSAEAFPTGLLLDLPPGWIMPTCKGFFPSKLASKNITKTLVDMFRHPVTSYFKISEDERDRVFFERFRTLVQWDPVHEDAVKKLFHSRASSRLSSIFNIARKKNKRPPFITPELWQTLIGLFNHPDQIDKQQKAKQNRASFKGGSVHTDGSINQVQHVQNISATIGRLVDVTELSRQTHVRKDTGEFVDGRARHTFEDYTARLQQALSQSSESSSFTSDSWSMDALKAQYWLEAAGGKEKGNVYGTGVTAPNILRRENPLLQRSTPATSQQSREILELRERMTLMTEENQQLKNRLAKVEELLMHQLLPPSPPSYRYEHEN